MQQSSEEDKLQPQLEMEFSHRGHEAELWLEPIRDYPGGRGVENYEYVLYIDDTKVIDSDDLKALDWERKRLHFNMRDYAKAYIDGVEDNDVEPTGE